MPVYRTLYSLLSYFIFPVFLLRLLWRSRKNPKMRQHWQHRLGFISLEKSPRIWLHTVSVGETIAAKPLVQQLLKDFPEHKLLITNTTATGFDVSQRLFGEDVEHAYFPYDINFCVRRFLNAVSPSLVILMETEIWPNFLHHSSHQKIPVVIANARLSERSTRGYMKISGLIQPAIKSLSLIACRSDMDAKNFAKIGAAEQQISVVGNIKFDINLAEQEYALPSLRDFFKASSKFWVAASTHKGEDEIILQCFSRLKQINPALVLVLIPRHPERFDHVYELCKQSSHRTARRSRAESVENCDIILGDTMGEMPYWYASADVVFLGGSFSNTGGHNPLEALVYGVPVVSGPTIFNFNDVYEILATASITWIEETPEALFERLQTLLGKGTAELADIRLTAQQTLIANQGATKRIVQLSKQLITPN